MKRIAIIFCLALVFGTTLGFAYTTPGTGVVWDGNDLVENSAGAVTYDPELNRYLLHEALTVAENDQVTIEADIQALVTDDPDITVEGSFFFGLTDSTTTDSLFLSGEDGGDGPGGIRINDTGALYLQRVIMEGGGADGHDYGIRVVGGDISAYGCRFTDWARYAVSFSGGVGEVINCEFHDNHMWTINITLGSSPLISNCTLVRNNLAGGSARNPISIGLQGSNSPTIEDCLITGAEGNPHGGISVWNLSPNLSEPIIRRCTIRNCAFGIVSYQAGAHPVVTDCIIENNTQMPDPMTSGSGITIQQGAEATIARNTITGNYWGITTFGGSSTAHLGDIESPDPDERGQNEIYDNGNSGDVYNFYNNTALPQLAQNNWWGSDDPEVVEEGIFHQPDDGSLGLVTYLPLYVPNSAPQLLGFSPEDTTLEFNVGDEQTFWISAVDPDEDELTFRFILDGDTVATDSTVTLTFDSSAVHSLMGRATDPQGEMVQVTWSIDVLNLPPVITSHEPEETDLTRYPDDEITFSIIAEDPDGDSLSYEYWAMGALVGTEPAMTHTVVDDSLVYHVTGKVFDTAGDSSQVTWTIHVADGVEDGDAALPRELGLTAWPNPFNQVLTLQVRLPEASDVRLEVYTLDGRRVANLHQGHRQTGIHVISWSAAGRSSGTYYIRLRTDLGTRLQAVQLVK